MTSRRSEARQRQGELEFPQWGGERKGAGRKPSGPRRNVEHSKRPELACRHPIEITLRLESGLESLRKRRTYRVVRDALAAGCNRLGLRLIHFSVMTNHVHLICEGEDARALSRGIKGLCVRIARGLNALWKRAGRVIADRYHARALKTPREVRNALAYVLHNARRHGIHFAGPDPCSTGRWFDGWKPAVANEPSRTHEPPDVTSSPWPRSRTWLLSIGWKRHGLIDPPIPAFSFAAPSRR